MIICDSQFSMIIYTNPKLTPAGWEEFLSGQAE